MLLAAEPWDRCRHKLVSVGLLISHALPLIGSLIRAQTQVIGDGLSRAEHFNLVEGRHTTNNGEKDQIVTDLDVIDDGGDILGRCVDPLSSASETLEAEESRPRNNSDLCWNLNFRNDPRVGENKICPQVRNFCRR